MRLSHKRKVAHKKGLYRLPCTMVRQIEEKIATKLSEAHQSVTLEINVPGGEVGVIDRAVNAFKRLAGAFRIKAA
ncbi:MAG: hypothetical protein CML20_23025 [Rheinheimera sp.]|nr:hypothetical protein [Rheinheimera sp.]